MSKVNNIHRGELLKLTIARSDLSITIITKRAGYSRGSYYNHILNPDLSFTIIQKYGKAMGYDFSIVFPEMREGIIFADPENAWGKPLTLDVAVKQRDFWKDKYVELLEKYHKIIEERLNGV